MSTFGLPLSAPHNVQHLLNDLAELSAQREEVLMDSRLLKTIHSFLAPRDAHILRLDSKGVPYSDMRFMEGAAQISQENVLLNDDERYLMQRLSLQVLDRDVRQTVQGWLYGYLLINARSSQSFLFIETDTAIAAPQEMLLVDAIEVSRNVYRLLRESQCDQLTGLANRKTFEASFHKLLSLQSPSSGHLVEERRFQKPDSLWLSIVDIDNFKRINDRFGHVYGDEVLLLLSQVMKKTFREHDLIFRFGGEEFVVLMRCTEIDVCAKILERFRANVESLVVPQVGHVTVSVGVTEMKPNIYPAIILDCADKALYYGKSHGKNQVFFYEELVRNRLIESNPEHDTDVTLF